MKTIRDVMTPDPISIGPERSLLDAIELLVEYEISGLPVVDPGDKIVGVLSERDLLKTYKKYNKPVIVIDPSADVAGESAKILEDARVPVYITPERAADVMGVLYRRAQYLKKIGA